MRLLRALLALASLPFFSACGYIHFGRLPNRATVAGDAALAQAYTDLTLEQKILKQELALARKEGDALRKALERTGSAAGSADLAARLEETTRELAALRVSHAKLQSERAAGNLTSDSVVAARVTELESQLGASTRETAQLREENSRLRADVDRHRTENLALGERLKSAVTQYDQAQSSLAHLNTELLAQKQARTRAEQATEAARAQLAAVLAQKSTEPAPAASTLSAPAASGASMLSLAKAPPAGSLPTAELRTNIARLREAASGPVDDVRPATGSAAPTAPPPEGPIVSSPPASQAEAPAPAAEPPPAPARPTGRVHVVQAGDTLEKLARQYYGAPEQWLKIYNANEALLGSGQPLRAGMELQVPEDE